MRTMYKPYLVGMLIALIGITAITSAKFAAGAASDFVGVTKSTFGIYYISTKYATAPANDTTQFVLMTVDSIEEFSTSTNITYSFQILFDSDAEQPGLASDLIAHEIPDPINLDPENWVSWLSLAIIVFMIQSYEGFWIMNKQQLPKELALANATSGVSMSIKYDANGLLESLAFAYPDSTDMSELKIIRLNLYIYIGAGVLGAVILIIIIAVCAKRKR